MDRNAETGYIFTQPVELIQLVGSDVCHRCRNAHLGGVFHQAIDRFISVPHGIAAPHLHPFRDVQLPPVTGGHCQKRGHVLAVDHAVPAGVVGIIFPNCVLFHAGIQIDSHI